MPKSKKSVYIETSVVSYLTARPSSSLLAAAWQKVTIDWWDTQRSRFMLYASEIVIEEAGRGDRIAIDRRIQALAGIPLLSITEEVISFSKVLIEKGILPQKAVDDALHIALAAVHEVDYLLSWNYKHIVNAEAKPMIRRVCLEKGYVYPEICTPQELMEEI